MIQLKNISKRFGNVWAVRHMDLTIPTGELFGFLGPNGAGKTTTIKMMGGILRPTSGEVLICGIPMASEPEAAKQKIGFIPDRPYLYDKLTGLEFLKFIADLYGIEAARFDQKAATVLEQFALANWSQELIESYSHGMKQRLIMAAALLHDPDVIIVDEPMVGLDPAGIKMVQQLFKTLTDNGVTIFMSTHTLKIAEDLCDRIGIIHKGALMATGSPKDLKTMAQLREADLESAFLKLTTDN